MPPSKIRCVARGSDSVDHMGASIKDDLVQFCLVKIPLGSGTFKRNKIIHLHSIGSSCGPVKRGKHNAELPKVLELFGPTHAGMEIHSAEETKLESILTKLQKAFVSDDGTFSIQQLKEEYTRRIEEERRLAAPGSPGHGAGDPFADEEPHSPRRQRKLATELGLKEASVLKAVREEFGPINWAIFEPNAATLTLVEGGSNGVEEMCEELLARSNKVYFGLFRMGFGTGRFRRTKHLFFHYVGDSAPAVARAKWNMLSGDMMNLLRPFNVDIRLQGEDDTNLKAIIQRLQDVFVSDHIKGEGASKKKKDEAEGDFSAEAYIQALIEEQEKTAEFYEEPPEMDPNEFDVEETVRLLRSEEGGVAWAVFQIA
eukprot:PhM_4_TR13631/c0_g1_i1/m.13221